MNIDYEDMKGRAKNLYKEMWGEYDFSAIPTKLNKTYSKRYKRASMNSYSFCNKKCEKSEMKSDCNLCEFKKENILIKTFGLENNKDTFLTKYGMATSGSGGEGNRITTLHSSSLCALLHFYNIDNKPLTIAFDTYKKGKTNRREVTFTKSFFEYKNIVINNPSNMDVVLLGEDKNGEKVILFLESKFSEYYMSASSVLHDISEEYEKNDYSKPLYEELRKEDKMHLERKDDKKGYFKLESEDMFYIGGIKQMISHYVGVMNAIKDGPDEKENPNKYYENLNKKLGEEKTKVILGEIIFDNRIGNLYFRSNPEKGCADIYKEKYNILAKKIGKLQEDNDRFEIIENVLSYSLFKEFKDRLDPNVRKFYRYE